MKIKYFIAFHYEKLKKPSSLRLQPFVEKELIGKEWNFISTQKIRLLIFFLFSGGQIFLARYPFPWSEIKSKQDNICKSSYFPWVLFVSNFIKLILRLLNKWMERNMNFQNMKIDALTKPQIPVQIY